MISENMLSQGYLEGYNYQVLNEISEHSVYGDALNKNDGFIQSCGRNLHPKKTTRGWKLEIKQKNGSLKWVPLKDLKASNPVELYEYEIANNIEYEPVLNGG